MLRLVASAVVIMYFVVQLSKYRGLPVVLIMLAVLVLIYGAVTNRSVFGRHVYAIGGNLQAATLSGIKTKAVTFWVFVNMGVLSALAGIVFAARINLAIPPTATVSSSARLPPPSSAERRSPAVSGASSAPSSVV